MSNLYLNKVEKLIDLDRLLEGYGCVKVEYRAFEDKRYYIYAFNNSLEEWDFDNGELIGIVTNKDIVNYLKKIILTIESGDFFCKECFRKKDISNLSKDKKTRYWCFQIWNGTPYTVKQRMQNEILLTIPAMDWSMVKEATDSKDPFIFYGICSDNCMTEDEFNHGEKIQNIRSQIQSIWQICITDAIMEGTEDLLEAILCEYIGSIEDNMKLISNQYKVGNGIIDILAQDKNGVKCIIELKVTEDDKNLIWQSAYYPSCFDEEVRMITIAPNYSSRIYNALRNVKNVEMKVFGKNEDGIFEIKDFKVENTELGEIGIGMVKDVI
ncbi:endonuclease NucS [Bacillus cereus]|nr:endonuclease NucS [Bacillus cereus]